MANNDLHDIREGLDSSVSNAVRAALGVAGLVSLVVGIAILVWPAKTAAVVAAIIAVYTAIAGVVNIALGIFTRKVGGWRRIGFLLLGVVFLVSAVIVLLNLGGAAAGLGILIGILVGVAWIVEGIVGLTMLGDSASRGWTILFAVLSIVAGVALLSSPLWGAVLLWQLLGISLIILGVVQVVRAFRFGSR